MNWTILLIRDKGLALPALCPCLQNQTWKGYHYTMYLLNKIRSTIMATSSPYMFSNSKSHKTVNFFLRLFSLLFVFNIVVEIAKNPGFISGVIIALLSGIFVYAIICLTYFSWTYISFVFIFALLGILQGILSNVVPDMGAFVFHVINVVISLVLITTLWDFYKLVSQKK